MFFSGEEGYQVDDNELFEMVFMCFSRGRDFVAERERVQRGGGGDGINRE